MAYDPAGPGAYHYSWANGINDGYGFSSRRSDHARSTVANHEVDVRDFLAAVDPATGYIKDDPEEVDGEDVEDDPGPGHWQKFDRNGNVIDYPDIGAPD